MRLDRPLCLCCRLFTVKKLYSKITETVKKDLAYEAELEAKNTGLSRGG